jgi:hypothetical protein
MKTKEDQPKNVQVPANKLYWMASEDDRIVTSVPDSSSKEYEAWVKDRDE